MVKEKIGENVIYLLYLLEAIINCTRYDYNIKHTLSKGLLRSFNSILDDKDEEFSSELSKGMYTQMKELILSACKRKIIFFFYVYECYKYIRS